MVFKISDIIIIVPILHSSAGSKRVVVISLAEIPHRVRAQSLNIVPGLQCATSFIQLLKNAASLSVARSMHSSRFLVSPAHICEYN